MDESSATEVKGANTPPYVSFATLRNFIRGLGEKGVPGRIDRTVMSSLSGGVQNQITTSLKYLKLVDSLGVPTDTLHKLATANEAAEKETWKGLIEASYSFLFKAVNLKTATTGQVSTEFTKLGASGDTTGKCISFFLAACKASGIAVSAHIRPSRNRNTSGRKKPTAAKAVSAAEGSANSGGQMVTGHHAGAADITRLLMEKFPNFDPAWPDNLKASWFAAYEQLMERNK